MDIWEDSVRATHSFLTHAGLGKKLIQEAMSLYPITDVVVNEQNQQAIGFYEHMGFEVYDRSAIDEHGGTFPILFMRKP